MVLEDRQVVTVRWDQVKTGPAPCSGRPLGVAAGCVAIAKGDKWWGAAGVSGSAVAAVVGYYLATWLVA